MFAILCLCLLKQSAPLSTLPIAAHPVPKRRDVLAARGVKGRERIGAMSGWACACASRRCGAVQWPQRCHTALQTLHTCKADGHLLLLLRNAASCRRCCATHQRHYGAAGCGCPFDVRTSSCNAACSASSRRHMSYLRRLAMSFERSAFTGDGA